MLFLPPRSLPTLALSTLGLGIIAAQNETPATPPAILSGSLYFDAWQLEKEFVVSPLALQQWLDLGLSEDSLLTKAQREEMKPKIGEFLAKKCPATIEGELIDFTLDRLHFIEPNNLEFTLIDPEAEVAAKDVRISAVFAAPNTELTKHVQLIWNLFPRGVASVPVTVADVAGTRPFKLNKIAPSIRILGRYELGAREAPKAPPAPQPSSGGISLLMIILLVCDIPIILWIILSRKKSPVAIALLVLIAGGAAVAAKFPNFPVALGKSDVVSEEESAEVLDALLRGVYHAFNYTDQSEQYDVLAKSVGGDALTDIYLEVRRTLESREKDGSRVRVNDLKIEESVPSALDGRRGFEARCSWEVKGRVGHWGHFHDRTNLYSATFTVEPLEESWKITGLTLHARDREPAPEP